MATEPVSAELAGPSPPRNWPRAEWILLALALLSLALIPVRIRAAYGGLPAHPLLLHVPVILIPVAAVSALVLAFRPQWIARHGVALATVTVVALAGTILTMGAGAELRSAIRFGGGRPAGGLGGRQGMEGSLIAQHAHAAGTLRLAMIAFTVVVIAAVLCYRVADGRPVGRAGLDRWLAHARTLGALRGLLGVLAVVCAYFVFHTGDLGAKSVWSNRFSGRGRPGMSFPGPGRSGGPGSVPFRPGQAPPGPPGR